MLLKKDFILIEDYLDGYLSEKDNREVEKRILIDTEFRKEFRLREEINAALFEITTEEIEDELLIPSKEVSFFDFLNHARIKENIAFMQKRKADMYTKYSEEQHSFSTRLKVFKKKVKEAEQVYFKKNLQRKRLLLIRNAFTAAACIALLIWSGSYFFTGQPATISGKELFAAYYKPCKSLDYYKAHTGLFEKAMQNYEQGNYLDAIKGLTKLVNNENIALSAGFYLGISYIEINEFDKAIQSLKKVADSKSTLAPEALWYLGLCYLKTGENSLAIDKFKKVLQSEHSTYKKKAREIVKKIE